MRIRSTEVVVVAAMVLVAVAGSAHAAALPGHGTWETTLQPRDLDGNGLTDAFYDTDLHITWLRDGNAMKGRTGWDAAISWADNFSFGGYSDWRLPKGDYCYLYNCTSVEMGYLWYPELGNKAGEYLSNTGGFDFQHQIDYDYWESTEHPSIPVAACSFNMFVGIQHCSGGKTNQLYAIVVRDGDVAAVPEPETFAIALAGLVGLNVLSRRKSRNVGRDPKHV